MFNIECEDALAWLRRQPPKSLDLVFGSPPYEDARAVAGTTILKGQAWVDWMVAVTRAAFLACKGLVAWVVEGRTKQFRWSAAPALLLADLHRAGFNLRKPPIFHRIGIPGSGGKDWLKNDYEMIVCVTPPGRLPWSDPTAYGHPPKFAPGGPACHRRPDGTKRSRKYTPPKLANPGNVITCKVGGGHLGHPLAHENEAPFPLKLAEFFVRSFCPPGGWVADPFMGGGTTAHAAVLHGRNVKGCDLRQSQVDLALKRLQEVCGEPERVSDGSGQDGGLSLQACADLPGGWTG